MDTVAVDEEVQPTRQRASVLPPEERRSMIVQATLPLLLEHGEMVTTRQIADAAGIAEGTIFRVFPDKDAVITAVIDAVLDVSPLDAAFEALDPNLSFEATLRTLVGLLQQRSLEVWRLMSSVGTRFHEANRHKHLVLSEPVVAYLKRHREQLTVPPLEAARLLRALTVSLTHPSLVEQPMPPKRIVELFLHGAGAE